MNFFFNFVKFRIRKSISTALEGFARPLAWTRELWELDSTNKDNNGLQNEDLIVWMRTAALPSFRKLYRRVDYTKDNGPSFNGKLSRGRYTLEIDYSNLSLFETLKIEIDDDNYFQIIP